MNEIEIEKLIEIKNAILKDLPLGCTDVKLHINDLDTLIHQLSQPTQAKEETLINEVHEWQKETFGQATPLSKIAHLAEELQELVADLKSGNPDVRLEYADCFLLLFGSAMANGMSWDDIFNAVREKMKINRARKWGKPNADGVVNHIK